MKDKYNHFNGTETWNNVKSGSSKLYNKVSDKVSGKDKEEKKPPKKKQEILFLDPKQSMILIAGVGVVVLAGILTASPRKTAPETGVEMQMQTSLMRGDVDEDENVHTRYEPFVDISALDHHRERGYTPASASSSR